MTVFEVILMLILEHEGGKCNRAHDSGGKTNRGITQITYDDQCGQMMKDKTVKPEDRLKYKDVYDLTDQDVYKFYKYQFDKFSASKINNPETCYVFFDAVINHGPIPANKCLQYACNISEDGSFGPDTTLMANTLNQREIQKKMFIYREKLYRQSKNYEYNKNGWNNRLNRIRQQIEKGIMQNPQQNYNNYQFVQQQQIVNKPKQDPIKQFHEAIKMQKIPDLAQFEKPIYVQWNKEVLDAIPLINQYQFQKRK